MNIKNCPPPSVWYSTAALTQRLWVRIPLESRNFVRVYLHLLKLQLPLRLSYLHLKSSSSSSPPPSPPIITACYMKTSIYLQWLKTSFVLTSRPHRVSALVGLNISVTKDSKGICTGYVRKSTVPRNAGSPGQQSTNGVNSLRVCTTEQYVFLAGFTGQIHPSAGVAKAALRPLGILSSPWKLQMTLEMINTSV